MTWDEIAAQAGVALLVVRDGAVAGSNPAARQLVEPYGAVLEDVLDRVTPVPPGTRTTTVRWPSPTGGTRWWDVTCYPLGPDGLALRDRRRDGALRRGRPVAGPAHRAVAAPPAGDHDRQRHLAVERARRRRPVVGEPARPVRDPPRHPARLRAVPGAAAPGRRRDDRGDAGDGAAHAGAVHLHPPHGARRPAHRAGLRVLRRGVRRRRGRAVAGARHRARRHRRPPRPAGAGVPRRPRPAHRRRRTAVGSPGGSPSARPGRAAPRCCSSTSTTSRTSTTSAGTPSATG